MRAKVYVTLKRSVLDPQGKAVNGALHALGYKDVCDVRQGKFFEIDFKTQDRKTCETELDTMARKLLANPVIEEYRIEWASDR